MKRFLSLLIFCIIHCNTFAQLKWKDVQSGDLIFIGKGASQLSGAISDVTQTALATNYAHIGIIERKNDTLFMIHAGPKNGTERILLSDYLKQVAKEKEIADLYRIQDITSHTITEAIEIAKSLLGKPYNFSYVMNDSSYYCSDFVWKCFNIDSVFSLNPMTFKNADTEDFHPTWIAYYNKLNIPIPEGLPGCNPNGMAATSQLRYMGPIANIELN